MNREEVMAAIGEAANVGVKNASNPTLTTDQGRLYIKPAKHTQTIEVSPNALSSLFTVTGLTKDLARKLSATTFGRVVNESVPREMSLITKNDQVVEFVRDHEYNPIDSRRVVDVVDKTIPDVEYHRVMTLPHYSIRMEMVGVEQKAVGRGDLIRAGALVQFSPLGITKPLVQAFVVRLACTNGVTTNDILREFSFGGGDDGEGNVYSWMRHSVRDAYRSLNVVVGRFQQMRNERISPADRAALLDSLLREGSVRGNDAQAIQAQAIEQPPQTTYDLLNLMTWATSHVIENPRVIARTQHAIANFTGQTAHERTCPMCHRRI